jgi:CubicO group peptidase (beta-lactamase class C family)
VTMEDRDVAVARMRPLVMPHAQIHRPRPHIAGGCTNAPAKEPPASSTPTAAPTVSVPAIDVNEIDTLIQRVVAEKRLVGLNVGVMQDGKVVLAKGYGCRSLESKLPVTPSTMFGIGSVTKQFTQLRQHVCGLTSRSP